MKLSATVLASLLALSASAFRIDLWSDSDFQGTQRHFASI